MARPSKLEVAAINIRIPSDKDRNYASLISAVTDLHAGVKIMGHTYLAMTHFNPETGTGTLSKYSEIDVDGDWFDVLNFDVASPEMVDGVVIPDRLRPNLQTFDFILDSELHVIAFEAYSESNSLSATSVRRYLETTFKREEITRVFGRVEADIVNSIDEVERIIGLPNLKELKITIRLPNPDGASPDLLDEIEEALREQNAEELENKIKSRDEDGLKPNERTRKMALIAVDNGEVRAKSIVNGVMADHSTDEKPLKETDTYNRDEVSTAVVFRRVARQVFEKIRGLRNEVVAGE